MVVTKDYHKLWLVCFLFLLKSVGIHVLEEKTMLVM
jgi:hypothetical protein